LKKNVGKGFVELDFSELVSKVHIQGTAKPEKVIVLTDFFCGSSGDQFVEACKKSSKVTVVGRATMGITDYSNVAFKKWGNSFELLYPTSRSSRIDTGDGLTGIGVQPDIYLPWTPDHLFEDVDLKTAIALCEESRLAEKQ
jgi:C-terminal processing protease CtpA/Prc